MHVWNVILLSTSPRISRHILYISVFQNIWSLTCNVKFALFKVVYCHEGIHSSFWCINFILIYFTCFLCILFANAIPLNRKIVSHCISKNNNILYFLWFTTKNIPGGKTGLVFHHHCHRMDALNLSLI